MTQRSRTKKTAAQKRLNLVGIDEAGRGPLAGPVAVGAVFLPVGFNTALIRGVKDSKQLSAKGREEWYTRLVSLRRDGLLSFSVALVGAAHIDRAGIVPAIRLALQRSLGRLPVDPATARVLLDGGLRAPEQFVFQETIIRGDESEEVIAPPQSRRRSCATGMCRLDALHPEYDFQYTKGTVHPRTTARSRAWNFSVHRRTFSAPYKNYHTLTPFVLLSFLYTGPYSSILE
jgi:ribonuclease HII